MSSNIPQNDNHAGLEGFKNIDLADDDNPSTYGDGKFYNISPEELKGNLTAIKQLVNDYNKLKQQLKKNEIKLYKKELDLKGYEKTPYLQLYCSGFNILGVSLLGIGTSIVTTDKDSKLGLLLIILGIILSLSTDSLIYFYIKMKK